LIEDSSLGGTSSLRIGELGMETRWTWARKLGFLI
jgi:hypothetical protein